MPRVITDVSTHGYSCGLYALALEVVRLTPADQLPDTMPDLIKAITIDDVKSVGADKKNLKKIHKILREALVDAMRHEDNAGFRDTLKDVAKEFCAKGLPPGVIWSNEAKKVVPNPIYHDLESLIAAFVIAQEKNKLGEGLSEEVVWGEYLDYIESQKPFLSPDELTCLARLWGVELKICQETGVIGVTDEYSAHTPEHPLATVTITNPSRGHWMIWSDKPLVDTEGADDADDHGHGHSDDASVSDDPAQPDDSAPDAPGEEDDVEALAANFSGPALDVNASDYAEILAQNESFLLNMDDGTDSESDDVPSEHSEKQRCPRQYRAKPDISNIDDAWARINADGGVRNLLSKSGADLSKEEIRRAFVLQHAGISLYHSKPVTKEYKSLKSQLDLPVTRVPASLMELPVVDKKQPPLIVKKAKDGAIMMPNDFVEKVSNPVVSWLSCSVDDVLSVFTYSDNSVKTAAELKADDQVSAVDLLVKHIREVSKLVHSAEDSAIYRFYLLLNAESCDELGESQAELFSSGPLEFKPLGSADLTRDLNSSMLSSIEGEGDFKNASAAFKSMNLQGGLTISRRIKQNIETLSRALLTDMVRKNGNLNGKALFKPGLFDYRSVRSTSGEAETASNGYICTILSYSLTIRYIQKGGGHQRFIKNWRVEQVEGAKDSYLLLCVNGRWMFGGYGPGGDKIRVRWVKLNEQGILFSKLQSDDYLEDYIDENKAFELFKFIIEEKNQVCVTVDYMKEYVRLNQRKIFQEFLILMLRKHMHLLKMHRPTQDQLTFDCQSALDVMACLRFSSRCVMRMVANTYSGVLLHSAHTGANEIVGAIASEWRLGSRGTAIAVEHVHGKCKDGFSQSAFMLQQLSRELKVLPTGTYAALRDEISKGGLGCTSVNGEIQNKLLGEAVRSAFNCSLVKGDRLTIHPFLTGEQKIRVMGLAMLLCGYEGVRNPAIFMLSQMLLDLIIAQKVLWDDIFTDGQTPMPTVHVGITSISRKKNHYFSRYMPFGWEYPGATHRSKKVKKDKNVAGKTLSISKLLKEEAHIFTLWCGYKKIDLSEMTCSQLSEEISKAQKQWFSGFSK